MSPASITIDTSTPPVLIIDKEGFYGHLIAEKLRQFTNVVFVSGKAVEAGKNLLSLPYGRVLAQIPSENYSHIFFIPKDFSDTADHLDVLVKKAEENKARLVIVLEKPHLKKEMLDTIKTLAKDALIIVLGDIFGKGVSRVSSRELPEFLFHLKIKKSIKLPNMGLSAYYPVSLEDVFAEIIKLSFGSFKKGFYLVYPNFPITQLGIVRSLQQIDPEITIDFLSTAAQLGGTKEEKRESEALFIEGAYVLPEAYDALGKMQAYFRQISEKIILKGIGLAQDKPLPGVWQSAEDGKDKENIPSLWQVEKLNKKKKNIPVVVVALAVFFIVFVFCFVIFPVFLIFKGTQSLSAARNSLQEGNFANAAARINAGAEKFNFSVKIIRLAGITRLADLIENDVNTINSILFLVKGAALIKSGNNPYGGIALLQKGLLEIGQAKNLDFAPAGVNNFISSLKGVSGYFINNTDALVDVLGFRGNRAYLILFQNNMELRPGGGFIGSYAVLKINKGKVDSFAISDVYDADGQLKGHVEPPFPIRRYIGKVHLYLRDSNFDIDFPRSAYSSAFLLQLETGEKVDGVIAVDLSFAREIIGAMGGVYVPEYNTTVTADNFFSLAERYAEKDFFPGSSQKKDFLRGVFNVLKEQVLTKGIKYSQAIVNATVNGIRDKHILFVSGNPGIEDLFVANGISGSIWDGRIASGNTLLDSAGINEANIGVNKANAFIERSVSQNINITKSGSVSGILSVHFKNKSDGIWPGGEYKVYFQAILPIYAKIQNIAIDGVAQKTVPAITDFPVYEKQGFVPPSGLEVDSYINNNKSVSGFLISVPTGSEKRLDVYYTLTASLSLINPLLSYDLLFQKQPGTDSYPYEASITVPGDYVFFKGDGFIGENSQASYIGNISTDKHLTVTFKKK